MLSSVIPVQISLGNDLLQLRAEHVSPHSAAAILMSYPVISCMTQLLPSYFSVSHHPFVTENDKGKLQGQSSLLAQTQHLWGQKIQNKEYVFFSVLCMHCQFRPRSTRTSLDILRHKVMLTCWYFQMWLIFFQFICTVCGLCKQCQFFIYLYIYIYYVNLYTHRSTTCSYTCPLL